MAEESKTTGTKDTGSADNGKTMAALAYLIFFIPMLMNPRNEFAMYHSKQGLVLLIVSVVGNIVLGMIPIIGWMILPIFALGTFILLIMGFINALNGKEEPLPLIGQFASNFKY